jgi:hypothetical protein
VAARRRQLRSVRERRLVFWNLASRTSNSFAPDGRQPRCGARCALEAPPPRGVIDDVPRQDFDDGTFSRVADILAEARETR